MSPALVYTPQQLAIVYCNMQVKYVIMSSDVFCSFTNFFNTN